MSGQHLFGMFTGGIGNFFATGHAHNFFDTFGEAERLDVGRGVIGLDGLDDSEYGPRSSRLAVSRRVDVQVVPGLAGQGVGWGCAPWRDVVLQCSM
jgi:hypothetical protein